MIVITRCPTSGSVEIKKARRKWTGTFRGKTYSVPKLEFYECPSCSEKIYAREAMRKREAHPPALPKT
jgi:hypothetical protein